MSSFKQKVQDTQISKKGGEEKKGKEKINKTRFQCDTNVETIRKFKITIIHMLKPKWKRYSMRDQMGNFNRDIKMTKEKQMGMLKMENSKRIEKCFNGFKNSINTAEGTVSKPEDRSL